MTPGTFLSSREPTWHWALALWAELGSGSVSEDIWAEVLSPEEPALTASAVFLSSIHRGDPALLPPWLLGPPT